MMLHCYLVTIPPGADKSSPVVAKPLGEAESWAGVNRIRNAAQLKKGARFNVYDDHGNLLRPRPLR